MERIKSDNAEDLYGTRQGDQVHQMYGLIRPLVPGKQRACGEAAIRSCYEALVSDLELAIRAAWSTAADCPCQVGFSALSPSCSLGDWSKALRVGPPRVGAFDLIP